MPLQPRIEIEYCIQCRWLLRAAWMAQEFPEIKELKQLIRDQVAPRKDLGHVDRWPPPYCSEESTVTMPTLFTPLQAIYSRPSLVDTM